jgi:hypothetical protein
MAVAHKELSMGHGSPLTDKNGERTQGSGCKRISG